MIEILTKIFGLWLGGLISRPKERTKLINDFESIKRKIIYASIINDVPVLLKELRDFLVEKDLAENEGFNKFFAKWLNHPLVIQGKSAVNVYSSKEIENLKNELHQLKL